MVETVKTLIDIVHIELFAGTAGFSITNKNEFKKFIFLKFPKNIYLKKKRNPFFILENPSDPTNRQTSMSMRVFAALGMNPNLCRTDARACL